MPGEQMSAISRVGSFLKSGLEIVYPIFAAYAVITSFLPPLQQLSLFLSMTLVLVFLKYPTSSRKSGKVKGISNGLDGMLILLSILIGAYIYLGHSELVDRVGAPTQMDIIFGILATLVVLEGTRRAGGRTLLIIGACALLYAYFGAGFGIGRMITYLYTTTEGLYGVSLDVMMRYIVVFIIFGAVMESSGAIDFFMKFAQIIAGRWRSGPAQIAVIGSGLMGMVSGSAVANVVTVGSFTIPLMKKLGYEPVVAGGVETAASSGGQIMPPVMGAGAFLMAEFLNLPYLKIALAAALPAILYYFAVGIGIYFYAEKWKLKKIDSESLPKLREIIKESYYLVPLLCIIFFLVAGSTPVIAAFYAIILSVLITFFKRKTWLNPKKVFKICKTSTYNISDVSVIAAWAGILIGSFGSTGLSLKFSSIIVTLSGGYLIVCLVLTMVAAIFLGMGMPTTVVYIILAVLVAPALTSMGVIPLAAHMFVFFFGIMSMVTPPVAFAAYAASGIAGADFGKTGWAGFKLVIPSFIIAYVFIYDNSLLFQGSYSAIAWRFFVSAMGVAGMTAALQGWLIKSTSRVERPLCFAGGALLILPGVLTDILGLAILASALFIQILRKEGVASIGQSGVPQPEAGHSG